MLTTQLTAHDAFACHHSHYQMLRDAILQNTFCHKILFSTVSHVLFKRSSARKIFDYHFYTICRNKYSLACNYSSRKQLHMSMCLQLLYMNLENVLYIFPWSYFVPLTYDVLPVFCCHNEYLYYLQPQLLQCLNSSTISVMKMPM